MGIDGIGSSAPQALDAGRFSKAPEASNKATVPRPEPQKDPLTNETVRQGLPTQFGVPQTLPSNTRLRVDAASNRTVVQILDENNEVVRQIPPEALLDLSTGLNRLEGLLFNRKG